MLKWISKPTVSIILAALAIASALTAGYLMLELRSMRAMLAAQNDKRDRGGRHIDPYLSGPVKNRILKGYAELHSCYLEYLKTNPKQAEGGVTFDWQIDTNGDTLKPEVVRSELRDVAFENCLTAKIARWQFAPTPVIKYVEHRFNFKKQQ